MEKQPCVYMLANRRNGTLYVGVTSNLAKRVWEHKNSFVAGFTKRYGIHMLYGMRYMNQWSRPYCMKSASRNGKENGRSG